MYRFALRPRWIAVHAIVLMVVALFAVAGFWQLDRFEERRAHNALVSSRGKARQRPISDFLESPDRAIYRRIEARGRYDIAREVVLRGRSHRGQPGNHVLTPLVMRGGRALVVDRGWVPARYESSPVIRALPPDREVEVSGVVLPSEGKAPLTSSSAGTDRVKAVSRIDVKALARNLPYRTFPHYLVLRAQDPKQSELPVPASLAKLGEGPHRLYAIQWFLFIPIALIGYGAILRREARRKTAEAGTLLASTP